MRFGHAIVIINPAANHGQTLDYANKIEDFFRKKIAADIYRTSYPKEASELKWLTKHYDTVIVAGGDGTVHEVVNGMLKNGHTETVFGVLPTGSGNDFCRATGISSNLQEAIPQLLGGRKKAVDLGRVNDVHFVNSLGIGFDARVAHQANLLKNETTKTGLPLYLSALFKILARDFYCYTARISVGDDDPDAKEFLLIAVNNGPTYGGGFRITPAARIDDGVLDVCVVDRIPRWQVLPRLPFVITGRHAWMGPAHMYKTVNVVVESDEDIPAALDGELILAKRFDISIKPEALNVIVPERS